MLRLNNFMGAILRFLGDGNGYKDHDTHGNKNLYDIATTFKTLITDFMPAVMIGLGVVCAIYAIVLGVQYAQAEGEDKRGEVKKKLINGVIGILIAIILMLVMYIIANNADAISAWIKSESGK